MRGAAPRGEGDDHFPPLRRPVPLYLHFFFNVNIDVAWQFWGGHNNTIVVSVFFAAAHDIKRFKSDHQRASLVSDFAIPYWGRQTSFIRNNKILNASDSHSHYGTHGYCYFRSLGSTADITLEREFCYFRAANGAIGNVPTGDIKDRNTHFFEHDQRDGREWEGERRWLANCR
jgi:hypothetical protein